MYPNRLINMSKVITIKITKLGATTGPFNISDEFGNVIALDVPRKTLIIGISYTVDDAVNIIVLESTGTCPIKKAFSLSTMTIDVYASTQYTPSITSCIWRHLKNPVIYNTYYGKIQPYIIEYPFSYKFQDEILQNVKDYTKAYKYLPSIGGSLNECDKVETNDRWFNKAVLYNGQQSTGTLELVPKPLHNLKDYLKYPIYNTESKTITYTKSDNFYQYNTFWSLVKDKSIPLFLRSCESLSIDKIVNQSNMDYGKRSFKKETLRSKDLKVRHILDNRDDAHLVSTFIITPSMISYK